MTRKVVMDGSTPDLSPASVGGPVTNYRNVGGWGGPALKRIAEKGIYESKDWPVNYWQSNKYMSEEGSERALANRISDWFETEEGNFLQLASLVVDDVPCFIGVPNWGHEVEVTQILSLPGGKFGVYGPNSWGQYNDDGGFYQATENYIRGFDCYGTVTVLP